MRIVVRGRLVQRRPQLPRAPRSEHGKNPEENSRQLQPQCNRKPRQRSAHRIAKPLTPFLQTCAGLSDLGRGLRCLLPNPGRLRLACHRRRRSLSRSRLGTVLRFLNRGRIRRSCCIHSRRQRLGCDTSPNPKCTAKSNRIHTSKCSRSPHTIKAFGPVRQTPPKFAASYPKQVVAPGNARGKPNRGQTDEKCSMDNRRILGSRNRFPRLETQSHATGRTPCASSRSSLGRPPYRRLSQLSPVVL